MSVLCNYLVSQHLKKPIETTKWHVDFEHGLGQIDPRRLVHCALFGGIRGRKGDMKTIMLLLSVIS